MRVGIAAEHGGFALKMEIGDAIRTARNEVVDFGARVLTTGDDYPDYVVPLAQSVAKEDVERGLAFYGSGVGASVAANKVPGVRACLIHDVYAAHQGVEDDSMNML
jgi:ribose 5-phosphate isomerase B